MTTKVQATSRWLRLSFSLIDVFNIPLGLVEGAMLAI